MGWAGALGHLTADPPSWRSRTTRQVVTRAKPNVAAPVRHRSDASQACRTGSLASYGCQTVGRKTRSATRTAGAHHTATHRLACCSHGD